MKKIGIIESPKQATEDGWSPDGQTFIHFGKGYRVKKDLTPCCVGPVYQNGEVPKAPDASQDDKGGITTLQQVIVDGCQSFVTENDCKVKENENIELKNTLKAFSDALQSKSTGLGYVTTHNLSPGGRKELQGVMNMT